MKIAEDFCRFVREIYPDDFIPLHRPVFTDLEKDNLISCIDSNFVSSVGRYVGEFEELFANYVGAKYAVACVNGTSALHASLHSLGVTPQTEVLTQALSFVATANAISYCGATPIFIDVDLDTFGLSSHSLENWLNQNAEFDGSVTINKTSGKIIKACVPMHTFGLPCRIGEIQAICDDYKIHLVEDAAESLGSYYEGKHTGTFGRLGTFSFNGNKIITTGGGGMIVTDDKALAMQLKHLTTTGKINHPYEYFHDQLAYNYRMPNINAAIGIAQLEKLPWFLTQKEKVSHAYQEFFNTRDIKFALPMQNSSTNFWLNAILFKNSQEKNSFLEETNNNGVMTRPIWNLLASLPMYLDCQTDGLKNSKWLVDRVVNIPSSVPEMRER